ncbi:MAG: hypothetical protein ACLQUY_03270 [Ktedonobacterales bacterium]
MELLHFLAPKRHPDTPALDCSTAWDTLHEEGDSYELRRKLLLAFDVRVIVWRVGHSPRWVVLRSMEELVQGALSGDFQAHLLYDGDQDLAPAVLGDLAAALKREIRWRSKRSGQRLGRKSAVECEQGRLFDDIALRAISNHI